MEGESRRQRLWAMEAERAGAPSWAALCGARAGERKRPRGAGQCGQAAEWAGASRPGARKKKRGRKDLAGPPAGQCGKGEKKRDWARTWGWAIMEERYFFSKTNHLPNLFSLFSILSQIQIKFEFNFKSSSPTLNQKQYAWA